MFAPFPIYFAKFSSRFNSLVDLAKLTIFDIDDPPALVVA
jgi:hypothetical protein